MINERLRNAMNEQIKMIGDNQTGIILLDRELGARAFPDGIAPGSGSLFR